MNETVSGSIAIVLGMILAIGLNVLLRRYRVPQLIRWHFKAVLVLATFAASWELGWFLMDLGLHQVHLVPLLFINYAVWTGVTDTKFIPD